MANLCKSLLAKADSRRNTAGEHILPNSVSRNWLRPVTAKKLPRVGFHALRLNGWRTWIVLSPYPL
jgi:hypothetical protein